MIDIMQQLFNKYKFSPIGFFAGAVLIILSFVLPIDYFLEKGIKSFSSRCYVYFFILSTWFVSWYFLKEYFPKNIKNKIGIIVSITTENDKQKLRVKNDFIKGMKDIASRNNLDGLLNIISFEDYKASKAIEIINNYTLSYRDFLKQNNFEEFKKTNNYKSFNKLIKKTKGNFYIYGSIKERQDIENKYIINIDAFVRHKPLNINISSNISREFQAIFPKEISFFEKLEFRGFEFASSVVFLAARYMIGIVAMLSYDPFTAFKIHDGLLHELNKFKPQPNNIKLISEKLSILLTEELLQQSKYYDFKNDPETAIRLLEQAETINKTNYNVYIFRSYYTFKYENNPENSLKYCILAKEYSAGDQTWLYNQAFLHMYLENFQEGYYDYATIKESSFRDEIHTLNECILFNEEYLKQHPTFYQSLFILGYLYCFKKNNLPLALDNFELFLNKTINIPKYNFLHQKVISFVDDIKKEMNLV